MSKFFLEIFQNFQKTFKKFGQHFIFSNVPVDCQPATRVKREFLKISRRAIFQNIPMHVIEFSTEL